MKKKALIRELECEHDQLYSGTPMRYQFAKAILKALIFLVRKAR